MRKVMALLVTLAMLLLSADAAAAQSMPSQAPVDPIDGCNYHEETDHNLCGTFLAYWESNGGLPVFGYPITEEYEEENLDTGETYTVQYFERERFEYHPENAGTEYEVLLGRLGNEVLLMQGRDWQTSEKSDSSEANYFDVTGFAVAPEFIGYWSEHGLDFDEPGFSFRESLALFGYPISQAEMETNGNGDTVLTQWFERARFEFHPDNPEGQQVLLGLLGVEVLEGDEPEPPPPAEPDFTVVADGLNNPRHISFDADGALYVAEAGTDGDDCVVVGEGEEEFEVCFGLTGAVTRIVDGEAEQIATDLPSGNGAGPHDVVVNAESEIYVLFGLGGPPEGRDLFEDEEVDALGTLARLEEDGSWTVIADLAAYEGTANPDPAFVDSNPYAMILDGENFIVVDAGGNTLLQVTPEGEITTLAVFPSQMVAAPPFLELPEGTEIPMESVPTTVAKGPDGAYYVGELTGFPFAVDTARVWRVAPGEDPEVHATGFSAIGAIDFDSEGNLYVLEIAAGGLLEAEMAGPENPDAAASAVIKVAEDGAQTTLQTEGLFFATGLAIGADGSIYVSNMGVMPGMGQIVVLDERAAGELEPEPDFTVVAEGLDQPRHISLGADGALYVAVAGNGGDECVAGGVNPSTGEPGELCFGNSGSIVRIADGEVETIVTGLPSYAIDNTATGVHDAAVTADGEIYAVTGLFADPAARDALGELGEPFGLLIKIEEDGSWTEVADIAAYEAEANPEAAAVESNPYSLIIDGENFIVADASGNTLLQVTSEGEITTLAVFPPQMVPAPPFLGAPEGTEIPMESVPTSVVMGPDGAYYVGELTGFPFALDMARVWRVVPGEEPEVYETGFTNIGDLAFDDEGNLYVLEITANSLIQADPANPQTAASAITMVAPDGTRTTLDTEGLLFSTGMAIGADGAVYAVHLGTPPATGDLGQVVMLNTADETEE